MNQALGRTLPRHVTTASGPVQWEIGQGWHSVEQDFETGGI